MGYNAVLGLGFENASIGGASIAEATYEGNVPFPQQDLTATIGSSRVQVFHAIVSIALNNATAYGSEVNVAVRLGERNLAKYVIPTGQQGQVVTETIPIGDVFYNVSALTATHGGLAAGAATNYTIKISVFFRRA